MYLPFYLFDISVVSSSWQNVAVTVDGLLGHAVLFAGDSLEMGNEPALSTAVCDFLISPSDAAGIALDQYKGILLEHGLRMRTQTHAEKISEGKKIFYPFWIAYFKKKRGYDFKALDALSGEIQGVRMRRLFMKALKELG